MSLAQLYVGRPRVLKSPPASADGGPGVWIAGGVSGRNRRALAGGSLGGDRRALAGGVLGGDRRALTGGVLGGYRRALTGRRCACVAFFPLVAIWFSWVRVHDEKRIILGVAVAYILVYAGAIITAACVVSVSDSNITAAAIIRDIVIAVLFPGNVAVDFVVLASHNIVAVILCSIHFVAKCLVCFTSMASHFLDLGIISMCGHFGIYRNSPTIRFI